MDLEAWITNTGIRLAKEGETMRIKSKCNHVRDVAPYDTFRPLAHTVRDTCVCCGINQRAGEPPESMLCDDCMNELLLEGYENEN